MDHQELLNGDFPFYKSEGPAIPLTTVYVTGCKCQDRIAYYGLARLLRRASDSDAGLQIPILFGYVHEKTLDSD